MIIVKLIGGLGNQMFQYAAGKALASQYNTVLKLDKSHLEKNSGGAHTQREFELHVFDLKTEFASPAEIAPFLKHAESKLYRELYRKIPSLFGKKYIAENSHSYNSSLPKYGPDAYLEGFWQSEKYFSAIRDTLRKEFTFKNQSDQQNSSLLEKLNQTDSVSLHIRRADYVNDKTINSYHGTCDSEYYRKAVEAIKKVASKPELFIFSDDIAWCRENLSFDMPMHFIDHNKGKQNFEDMRLMSHCKHNIIANSSFSWWGAWLNKNKKKQVIAPKNWFKEKTSPDIYPAGWTLL